jgi:ectoine hydroxylase
MPVSCGTLSMTPRQSEKDLGHFRSGRDARTALATGMPRWKRSAALPRAPVTWKTMRPRTSPVVWSGTGPLSKDQLAGYEREGFLLVRDMLGTGAIARLQAEAETLAAKTFASTIRERDGRTVRSVFDVHSISDTVSDLVVRNESVTAIAEQILGRGIYVHQCHINFKRPHAGGEFFWHSDFTFWYWEDGMPEPRAVSILLFLDDQKTEAGPLFVVPGSHMWITQERWHRKVDDHNVAVMHDSANDPAVNGLVNLETLSQLAEARPIETMWAKAGDVLFMDGNLVHASGPNLGCKSRRILLLILNSLQNRIGIPFSGQPPRPEYISSRTFSELPAARADQLSA